MSWFDHYVRRASQLPSRLEHRHVHSMQFCTFINVISSIIRCIFLSLYFSSFISHTSRASIYLYIVVFFFCIYDSIQVTRARAHRKKNNWLHISSSWQRVNESVKVTLHFARKKKKKFEVSAMRCMHNIIQMGDVCDAVKKKKNSNHWMQLL